MIDLGRLRTGALDIHLRPVELAEALAGALEDLGAGDRPFDLELPDGLPDVIADGAVLTRIITGLTANALRRSPSRTQPAVAAYEEEERVVIRFVDHGPSTGKQQARGEPVHRWEDGSDITMAVCAGLASAIGGVLDVEETAGGGLTVAVSLPAARAPGTDASRSSA